MTNCQVQLRLPYAEHMDKGDWNVGPKLPIVERYTCVGDGSMQGSAVPGTCDRCWCTLWTFQPSFLHWELFEEVKHKVQKAAALTAREVRGCAGSVGNLMRISWAFK